MGSEHHSIRSTSVTKLHESRKDIEAASDVTDDYGEVSIQPGKNYSEAHVDDENKVHYQITHDDPNFIKLSLHPLISQFTEFAQLSPAVLKRRRSSDPDPKRQTKIEGVEKEIPRMSLFGIEAWFGQAKIFSTPLCKITVYDVRASFHRMQKQGLTFSEFESFIEGLAEFRKIHPDTIVFRLRLCGSPELEARLSHMTVPEGTVDRIIDAFKSDSENLREEFVNLSKEPYVEPICYGGIRSHHRKKGSTKQEQELLRAQAKEIMKKGPDSEQLDKLKENFIYFAKDRNYYSDGRSMQLTQLIRWFKQAGIINSSNISSSDIGFLFKRLYVLNGYIYFDDLHHFLRDLSTWKEIPRKKLFQKLRSCGPPASSSITVVSMSLPESIYEVMKSAFHDYAEDFEENREQYEPTSADGPSGHTPNSRNRHFHNTIEENMTHVHFQSMESVNKIKNADGTTESMMITTRKTSGHQGDVDEKEDTFSEERRGGKDTNTKRWNDAYPIGGIETGHRARIEADLEKLLFGIDRVDDSSSDDEEKVKKKIKAKYDVSAPSAVSHPAIPLDEQFEKFKRYGPHQNEDGITLRNIELWFSLAGVLARGTNLFTLTEISDRFNSFKFAQDHEYMDYDTFVSFLESLAASNKNKKTNVKELKERLTRCGNPRQPPHHSVVAVEVKKREEDKDRERSFSKGSHNATQLRSSTSIDRKINKSTSIIDEEAYGHRFNVRFHEFARFGEATVHDAPVDFPHGLSMLNADKWFRQAKLLKVAINPGDVDVQYKQLFPTKLRINMHEFVKLVRSLSEMNKNSSYTFESIMEALTECGSPEIHETTRTNSSPPTQTPSKM